MGTISCLWLFLQALKTICRLKNLVRNGDLQFKCVSSKQVYINKSICVQGIWHVIGNWFYSNNLWSFIWILYPMWWMCISKTYLIWNINFLIIFDSSITYNFNIIAILWQLLIVLLLTCWSYKELFFYQLKLF